MFGFRVTLFAGTLLLPTAIARADGDPIRVLFAAPTGCPTLPRFLEQVMAQAPRAKLAVGDQAGRTFHVNIKAAGSGRFEGELRATTASGELSDQRHVAGSSCDEVAQALALTMALALDPDAPDAPVQVSPANPAALAAPGYGWEWSVQAGGVAQALTLPEPMAGAGIGIEGGITGATQLGQRVRLQAEYMLETTPSENRALALTLATIEVSYSLDYTLNWGRIGAYVGLQPGLLGAEGLNISHPEQAALLWLASTIGIRLGWPRPTALRPHIELDFGAIVPLLRPKLYTDNPRELRAEAAAVGLHAALRIAFSLFSGSN